MTVRSELDVVWLLAVDKSGDVCISILHDPGEDKWGYEQAHERWLPIHTVTTIMVSVISMLADPNDESPANIDAAVRPRTSHILRSTVLQYCGFNSYCKISLLFISCFAEGVAE